MRVGAGGGGVRGSMSLGDHSVLSQHVVDVELGDADDDRAARGMHADATTASFERHGLSNVLASSLGAATGGKPAHRRTNSAPGKWSREGVAEFSEGQFMLPEWMVDVPTDLGTSWYVTPRPSVRRLLMLLRFIASQGGKGKRGGNTK